MPPAVSSSFSRSPFHSLECRNAIMQLVEYPLDLTPYPWQQPIWQSLQLSMHDDKLPHALLFSGIEGVGKVHLAVLLAHKLMCLTVVSELACGKCKSCLLMAAGSHPDLMLIAPEAEGKAIKIDTIRQVNDFLSKTPQQGGRKVVLITPAEAMTGGAANALLKSLEEPAGRAHIVLVSHQTSAVLSTIKSRCRLVTFGQPAAADVLPWLTPLAGSRVAPATLLALAGGAPLRAKALLDGDALELHAQLLAGLQSLFEGTKGPLDLAGEWLTQDQQQVLRWLQVWVGGLIRNVQWGSDVDQVVDRVAWVDSVFGAGSEVYLHRFYEKVGRARQSLSSGSNPNPQLLMEEIALDWQAMCRVLARQSVAP